MAFKRDDKQLEYHNDSIDDTINDTNFQDDIDFNNPDDLRKLYTNNLNRVSSSFKLRDYKISALSELSDLIERVNDTQKDFSEFKKMETSNGYMVKTKIKDSLKKFVGISTPNREIFSLFLKQQENISELNYVVANMIMHYKRTLDDFYEKTNLRMKEHDGYISEKLNSQSNIPRLRKQFLEIVDKLENTNQDTNPLEYNQTIREFRVARDRFLEERALWERSSYQDRNLRSRVKKLTVREEVFTKQLQNTMMFSEKVKNYQTELDDNVSHWIGSKNLAEGASYLMQGVDSLQGYNREMNEIFEKSVKNLVDIVSTHSFEDDLYETGIIEKANQDLEAISEERAMRYLKDKT